MGSPLPDGQAAVSDVLGAILMVGMTVIAAVGFGVLLLSFDGPADQLHADVELRTDPGTGGWGTGDETLQLVHLGGESIAGSAVTIRFTIGATSYCFGQGAGCVALASEFGDGALTIGETWTSAAVPLTLDSDTEVNAQVAFKGEMSQLLAAGVVTGTDSNAPASCLVDTTAPTGSFALAPSDLDTTHGTGVLSVTLDADDDCSQVNTAAPPNLHYRITPTLAGVPDDYSDAGSDRGPMAWVAGVGFVLDIPAPPGLGWATAYGRTVEFYASGLADLAAPPNVADTPPATEFVQLVGAQDDPPDTITLVAGAFTAAGPSSALTTDNGVNAILQEACMLDQPSLLNVQNLCGTVAGGVGVASASNAFFSDNVRSTHSGSNSYIEVTGFDVPGNSGDVSAFSVVWEGTRSSGSGPPTLAIEVNFGPDYSATSAGWKQVGSISPGTSEATTVIPVLAGGPAGGPWADAQFNNLHARARVNNGSTRTVNTDDLHIRPTYPGATTVRDLDAAFQWTGLAPLAPASEIRQLRMEYQVGAGETYTVEAFDGTAWQACGSLTATTLTAYTCDLSVAQVQAGPQVRILGAATSDTAAPASLQLDYLHMLVVT